ncbi:hypothetical protein C8A00DRAFT_46073 [Chaetomidium leptoderma]|uniref:JmjC domain-containing protein n=1 Tax=Chaetomidium leptoderma TaxID=669021 RepID=A0AAN6ZVP2_9PEZI|nr:hypothetical protein C8A00DRAFT_46073 [Chaetomidium leptoderma]
MLLHTSPRLCMPPARPLARRHFTASARLAVNPNGIEEIQYRVDAPALRRIVVAADQRDRAVVFRQQADPGAFFGRDSLDTLPLRLPALSKWFIHHKRWVPTDFSAYFRQHLAHTVPYELVLSDSADDSQATTTTTANLAAFMDWLRRSRQPVHQGLSKLLQSHVDLAQPGQGGEGGGGVEVGVAAADFVHFDAPLALLDAALEFNTRRHPPKRITQLYIAQAALADLPPALQLDVPTPELLAAPATLEDPYTADVYSNSLWLGLVPTFTPWHRDPNANLFTQLCGSKVVRLLPRAPGARLFEQVMAGLGKPRCSAAIRGVEMMQSAERQAWQEAVWGPDAPPDMLEVVVHPRDMLFFPKGWWHSVKSTGGESGCLNASVNWWFRWRKSAPDGSSPGGRVQANTKSMPS